MTDKGKDKKSKKLPEPQVMIQNGDLELLEEYKPKISSAKNYARFLQLVHNRSGSLSSDDGHVHDAEGYIEDDVFGDTRTTEDSDCEADHLYDNINSPTYEMASEVQDTSPMTDDPEAKERQMREWRAELEKVEQEITTLRQVLGSKVRYASELKRKLGISPLQEMKQDFSEGLKFIKESDTYQKTNQRLHEINDRITSSTVYQKTSAAAKSAVEKTSNVASSIGASVSRKLGDIRNSDTFKSLEVKVESTYASVKAKVTGSKSETSFEEALQSETNRMNAGNDDASKDKEMTGKLPEEKVPL